MKKKKTKPFNVMRTEPMQSSNFKFNKKKKTPEKIKLMLWVEKAVVDKLEMIRPHNITVQECIRQILGNFVTEEEDV
jgi:hypothetical protein